MKKVMFVVLMISAMVFMCSNVFSQSEPRSRTFSEPVVTAPQRTLTNSIDQTFVYIEPGSFMMGSPENEPGRSDWETQHRVTLTQGFYMQTTEVTQGQWRAIMGGNPSEFKNCGDDCPVEMVSWGNVQEFIQKLNRKEGGNLYRLPTEAEWAYAVRAGTTTAFYNGGITVAGYTCNSDPNIDQIGWYCRNSGSQTHPVAQKQPNAWGLYDMSGNVWEWCQDWYGDYPTGSVTDPQGPSTGSVRVLRGGGWHSFACICRSAYRYGNGPVYRGNALGFRLLRIRP